MPENVIYLVLITLTAAIVNGGLGYGFSSITVPLALLFLSNRVLNPALVLVEVALNSYVLLVNRGAVPSVSRRVGSSSLVWFQAWWWVRLSFLKSVRRGSSSGHM